MQHLLGRAVWDEDAVRDELQRYVIAHLGDEDGVLVIDETGFLKKGDKSAGVARQYSGTAGRIENCQIGVFPIYATIKGQTFLDRQLYLPKDWAEDSERRNEADIPEEVAFATKPKIARALLQRAFDAGVPAHWVTGDAVYGNDRSLQLWLQERGQAHVLAVSGQEMVTVGFEQHRVKTLLPAIPEAALHVLSAGAGSVCQQVSHQTREGMKPRPPLSIRAKMRKAVVPIARNQAIGLLEGRHSENALHQSYRDDFGVREGRMSVIGTSPLCLMRMRREIIADKHIDFDKIFDYTA